MATLDKGWRRLMTEIGVEFMDDRALDLFRAGRAAGRGQHRLPRPRLRARAGGQGAARVRRPGPQPGAQRSTSAATRWRSARSTARRSCARARCAATRRWTTSATSPSSPSRSRCSTRPGGVICEPNDTPLDSRHLDMTYALQTLTDKIYMGNVVSGRQRRRHHRDGLDPVRRRGRRSSRRPASISLINCNSPLRWDDRMLEAQFEYSAAGAARRADAVHPDGRDVAGDDPGRAGAADHRGAVRHRAVAADPARARR